MKGKKLAGLILLSVLLPNLIAAQNIDQTNDLFVRKTFMDLCEGLLAGFPAPQSCNLVFSCQSRESEFFADVLTAALKSRVSKLYIGSPDSSLARLEVHLYRSDFGYERSGGSLFSRGGLVRVFRGNVSAALYDSSRLLLWHNQIEKQYSEKTDWSLSRDWTDAKNDLFSRPLPSTEMNRIWEPVIIGGLLAGLVYLFFASR